MKNPLFTIISSARADGFFFKPVIKSSKDSCPYFMIELPKAYHKLNIDGGIYHVDEQHISIFEDVTPFSRNSLYHCTVTLKARDGLTYKLRAYFDKNDHLIDGLSLKSFGNAQTEAESVVRISRETQKMLTDILLAQCSPVIREVVHAKNQQREAIKTRYLSVVYELKQKIDALKSKDVNLAKTLIQDLDNLQPELMSVRKTVPGFRDSERLRFKGLLIQKISEWNKAQASNKMASNAKPAVLSQVERTPVSTFFAPDKTKTTELSLQKKRKTSSNHSSDDFSQDFQAFCNKYETLNISSHSPEETAPQLISLNQELHQLTLRLALENIKSTDSYQAGLKDIELFLTDLLSDLLRNAILNDKMHLVLELSQQAKVLPEAVLKYALDKQNAKLVELYFKKHPLSINQISLTTETGSIVDVLTYAMENGYYKIFGLLLKFGANPLVVMADGLPLLHNIINNSESPFYLSTIQYLRSQGYKCYFEQLCVTLQAYIESHELSEDKITELKQNIQQYQMSKDYSSPVSSKEDAASTEHDISFIKPLNLSLEFQSMVKTNPAVMNAVTRYQTCLYESIKKLSKEEYRKLLLVGRNQFCNGEKPLEDAMIKKLTPESLVIMLDYQTAVLPLQFKAYHLRNSKDIKGQSQYAKLNREQLKSTEDAVEEKKQQMAMKLIFSSISSPSFVTDLLGMFAPGSSSNSAKETCEFAEGGTALGAGFPSL